jgi:acetyltransferase-like isoleucine patch superfamily enzyme
MAGVIDCELGEGVRIIDPVNIYGAVLHSGVFVGPFCEIQNDVSIGANTRVQSHTFICSMVSIGEDCFIGHGVMFTNDLLQNGPARGDKSKWLPTTVGNRVSIGSNATILPISICDNVVIGAGSVVTKHITKPGVYAGNPARLIRDAS